MSIRPHRPLWDQTRIEQAQILAKRSLCTRDQVGAIIVDAGNKVIGEGYNGPPAGFKAQETPCTNWCQRAKLKTNDAWVLHPYSGSLPAPAMTYENGEHYFVYPGGQLRLISETSDETMQAYGFKKEPVLSPGYDDCPSLHAEANALITSDRSLRIGGAIYVTSDICMGCAKLIANSGLTRVYVKAKQYDKHRNPDASYAFLRKCGLTVHVQRPGKREGWDPSDGAE